MRILVLHGYTQSAQAFVRQTAAVRKHLTRQGIELDFIDAPILLTAQDLHSFQATSQISPEPSFSQAQAGEGRTEEGPRAWFRRGTDADGEVKYEDIHLSFVRVGQVLAQAVGEGRVYDGVLGFSQGAGLGAMVVSLLAQRSSLLHQGIRHPPLRFGLFVSGFKADDRALERLYPLPERFKSVHIIGKVDRVVSHQRSRALIDACHLPIVLYHKGGHIVPFQGVWKRFYTQFISSFDDGGSQGDGVPLPEE